GLTNLKVEVYDDLSAIGREVNPDMPGFYARGRNTVYLFSRHIVSEADVQTILRHEVFSHFAVDSLTADQRKTLYSDLAQAVASDSDVQAYHKKYVAKEYGAEVTNDSSEELLGRLAEDNAAVPFSTRLVAGIRRILRDLGFPVSMTL